MMPDMFLSSKRTAPTVQVPKLIQQKLFGGLMNNQCHRFSSRNQRRGTGALPKIPGVQLAQTNLAGDILVAKDSESFGIEFPTTPDPNCSIVIFQNTGQMDWFTMQVNSQQIVKAFKESNVSVAMYTGHYFHKSTKNKIPEHFHARMISWNPSSLSK